MALDLVVPDLLLPVEAPAPLREVRLVALERWLARADIARAAAGTLEDFVGGVFSLPSPVPVAAVTLAADVAPEPGHWLRADPVYLRIDQQAIALHGSAVLDVTPDEAHALVAELQSLFGADGLEFRAPHPERWYVRVPATEMPSTTPIAHVLGRNVFGLLPRGSGRINWASAITEAQMIMTAHGVNEARERAGRPPINSVWFWGEGEMPAGAASPYALVYSDEPLGHGSARLAGVRHAELPRELRGIDAVRGDESALVVLDALSRPLARGDAEAWIAAARALDETWFAKLGEAIERFERVRLVLPSSVGTLTATLTAGSRWRWFRSRKPLSAHA